MSNLNYVIYPQVDLQPEVTIGEYSVIGKPTRRRVSSNYIDSILPVEDSPPNTVIGHSSTLGTHVLVEQGAYIGTRCIIEAHAVIETAASIGDHSLIVHGARIGGHSIIGKECVIGGFVAERSRIGDNCRVFGSLIHRQIDPTVPWDESIEPAPVLEDHVFVAMTAVVVGKVHLASHVYITAGAIVTKDVPPFHIVHGVNNFVPAGKWRGRLSESAFWR